MIIIARLFTPLGAAVTVVGLSKIHAVMNSYDYTGSTRFGFSIALIVLISIAAYAVGLPDLTESPQGALAAATKATLAAALGVSVLQLFLGDALLPRFVVLGAPLILIPWLFLCAAFASKVSRRAAERDLVFVIATEEHRKALADDLQRNPERSARIVGALDPDEASGDRPKESVEDCVKRTNARVLVLDGRALLDEGIVSEAGALHQKGLRVRTLVAFYEEWLGKLPISELKRASLMFDIGEVHRARYSRVKRLVDVLVSTVGLVILVILLPFLYLGILTSGNKKLLYKQRRVGKGGSEFWMYKLATMAPHAEDLDTWTTLDDPRISRFGRMLRRSHLDELPQMVNILKAELSLVGPRPEQPHYVRSLADALPYYMFRYSVTPGLTGWAQVKFGYAGSDADAFEKLQYDFYYLSKQSLGLDLLIVGRTLRNVVGLKGR